MNDAAFSVGDKVKLSRLAKQRRLYKQAFLARTGKIIGRGKGEMTSECYRVAWYDADNVGDLLHKDFLKAI